MDPQRWGRIKAVFQAARGAPDVAVEALLDQHCRGDDELRREVLRLLRSDRAASGFLDAETLEPALDLPARIGPYRLVERIGEGGMGTVYRATEESPTKREVAVKLLRATHGSPESLLRFEAEQRALALMDHPGIARIHTAGVTDGGRPYFAMEYVPGSPITEYCDDRRLDVAARLELFLEVCEAVRHAHEHGVVHRDLKPSNILVASRDGLDAPKVIDFGIAKAIGLHLTDDTLRTRTGVVVGTPEYMSPEQADPLGAEVGPVSDVYSLGVILYRLVAGVSPFQGSDRATGPARFGVPRPSDRMGSVAEGELRRVLFERGTDQRSLCRTLCGLDPIVAKALSVNPESRYSSAADLARDIKRFLGGKRVEALGRRVRPSHLLYALAGIGALATLWTLGPWGQAPTDARPRSVEVQGDVMRVVNAGNETLWEKRFDSLVPDYDAMRIQPQRGAPWLVEDVIGDSRPEVLFIERRLDDVTDLHAYDQRGKEFWDAPFRFGPVAGLRDPASNEGFGVFAKAFLVGVVSDGGRRLLLAHACHSRYPDRILLLDAADGSVVSEYVHPGYIYALRFFDLDRDGQDEIVMGGVWNPGENRPFPIVTALEIPFELRPSRDRHVFGPKYQMEMEYVVLAGTEQEAVPNVEKIEVAGDSIEVGVRFFDTFVYYRLVGPSLRPVALRLTDAARRTVNKRGLDLEQLERDLSRYARFDTAPMVTDEEIARRFEPIEDAGP